MKRFTAILLILATLAALLSACGTDQPVTADTTVAPIDTAQPSDSASAETEPGETTYPGPVIEEDYSGKTLRVLTNEKNTDFPFNEVVYDDEAGDIINDAIFKRNAQITEKYGVTIEATEVSTGTGMKTFTNAINAGNDDFHFATIRICDIMSAAQQGFLADVAELPYLDLDAPWYYQNMRRQLSIGEREYLLIGYFNMRVFETLSYMAYNKPMVEKFSLPDLNRMALDGKWTIEKMYELSKQVTVDVDQDGKLTGYDQMGIISHSGYILTFFVGMGGSFVEKDADDLPIYVGLSEKNNNILTTITDFLYDQSASIHGLVEATRFDVNPFALNQQLFAPMLVYGMRSLADQGVDYGIIPFPKADEQQENYVSPTHSKLGTAVGIPNNNSEIDFTAAMVAELMHHSYEIIYPAHIERAMELRYSPDEDSTEMLKLLFSSICIEMSTALNLTPDTQLRTLGGLKMNNFAAVFKSIEKANTTLVNNYVKAFTGE